MNKQEILNTVYKHFIVDRKPFGITEKGICQYQTDDGNMCAVGIFIDQKNLDYLKRTSTIEASFLHIRDLLFRLIPEIFTIENAALFNDLQAMHDAWGQKCDRKSFAISLRTLANRYGLKDPKTFFEPKSIDEPLISFAPKEETGIKEINTPGKAKELVNA